jgi:hypothetical protein
MPRHDLEAVLAEVLTHFWPLPHRIHIDWIDLDSVDPALFSEHNTWALCHGTKRALFIGLHPDLRGAPRYVVRYIVFHEVLHLAIPPHRGQVHTRAFNVAERLWSDYIRANHWLQIKAG